MRIPLHQGFYNLKEERLRAYKSYNEIINIAPVTVLILNDVLVYFLYYACCILD